MEQYISKDAVVAEIQGYISGYKDILSKVDEKCLEYAEGIEAKIDILQHLLSFLDSLEVKDVDVEKESELIANSIMISVQANLYHTNVYNYEKRCYKHSDLKDAARKLIMGLPDAETVTVGQSQSVQVYKYDDRQVIPNVGIGFVIRYMESGVTSYQPVVFTKASFNVDGIEAATQEEEIEFQTTELEASLMRDDSTNHVWRIVGEEQTTEASAEAVVRTLLNITGAEDENQWERNRLFTNSKGNKRSFKVVS